ncbi:MAG: mechanosensitive ion channel family protein [Bacteroidetes bacterium]|nr:MAG: mechanosensitive ion channel family protein [Bacteroidota bacterium]
MENFVSTFGFAIAIVVATFVLAFMINRVFARLIRSSVLVLQNDPTNYKFLRHMVVALVYIVGFSLAVYTIPDLRALAGSLLAGAGILAVAVSFASQQALSNIISGVFIVIFKPFRINDRLRIQTYEGIVEDITLRHTMIRDFENKRVVIPNSVISNEVIVNANLADDRIVKWIDVGISYDSDIDLAKRIMAEEVRAHPNYLDVRTPEDIENGVPEVTVRVILLGESSVNLRAWAWARSAADGFVLSCDVYESIKKRFDREGIEIPFPHRTIVYKDKK